ncbi:MAG: FmdB family zinc ribbon protein [Syntrophothermus sp.]
MPIFEYQCKDCNTKFEILHKSSSGNETVACPKCNSENYKKLLSTFSASVSGGAYKTFESPCASGQCNPDSFGGCSSGMCGLN